MNDDAPVLVVYNPVAGRGRASRFADELASELNACQIETELQPTSPDSDVFALVDVERYRAIVIVGGDGSFHAAVNSLPLLTRPLVFAGTGTINVLARELKLPRTADAIAQAIVSGRTVRVPVLVANGRRFVLFAELGFMGEVVASVDRWRERHKRHGKTEFVLRGCGIVPFRFGLPVVATITHPDGTTTERRYSNVLVTRARRYAGTLPMPTARGVAVPLADPEFDVVGYRSATPLGHTLLLALAAARLLPPLRHLLDRLDLLECQRATAVEIRSTRPTLGHLDAESKTGHLAPVTTPLSIGATDLTADLIVASPT